MDIKEAVTILDNTFPGWHCDDIKEAWKTLKASVLAQQTTNKQSMPFYPCNCKPVDMGEGVIVCSVCSGQL